MYFQVLKLYVLLIFVNGTSSYSKQNILFNHSQSAIILYNPTSKLTEDNNKDDMVTSNNTILKTEVKQNFSNIEEKQPRKRKRKNKKQKFLKSKSEVNEFPLIDNNIDFFSNTSSSKSRKTRRRRKRRRNKKQHPNISETTTATALLQNQFFSQNNNDSNAYSIQESFKSFSFKNTSLGVNFEKKTIKKNRCNKNNGECSQICKRTGKRKCSCIKGYILAKNRKKCIDIDECKFNSGGCKHTCRNTLGGYFCECPQGFRLSEDFKSCEDINECHLRNGHGPCQDTCTNTHGSYICDCSHLNGTRLGKNKHICEDINECDEGISGCTHLCINTNGGVFCSCPEAMELMSDYKTCQDVDECEVFHIKQLCRSGCINTIGSYNCEGDFQSDQSKKKIPVCPPLDPPQYGFISCQNQNNSTMYNERKIIKNIPGTKCHLICPEGFELVGSNRLICEISGKWTITKKGFCTRATYPKLKCPSDQTFFLDGQDKLQIRFSRPETNIRWKIVKSYPEWAKNLKGELEEGHHNIHFTVTDPATKLSSTCFFSIIIKK